MRIGARIVAGLLFFLHKVFACQPQFFYGFGFQLPCPFSADAKFPGDLGKRATLYETPEEDQAFAGDIRID